MTVSKKALITSAFFLLFCRSLLAGQCAPPGPGEPVTVDRVYDGDTLRLEDGRRVRLIGVNTPELGRDGAPDQPLARQATRFAERFVAEGAPLRLHPGADSEDHYGRTLAHLFDARGHSLEEALVEAGLGFWISIPPNLALRDCLHDAENRAREADRGLWALAFGRPRQAGALTTADGGFHRVSGLVTRVGQGRNSRYLELDDRLFVLIRQKDLGRFDGPSLKRLEGQRVTLRGWIIPRDLSQKQRQKGFKPFMLNLSHPDAFE